MPTEPDSPPPGQALKDLVAGAAGGMAQVLIGQPFDIVKVRLQTSSSSSSSSSPGAAAVARSILANEGALAFYKGTAAPLVGVGACVSVQFGAFHAARRFLEDLNAGPDKLSHAQHFAAGAFAGVASAPLSSPIEHVRIRLQTQDAGNATTTETTSGGKYRGPLDCARRLVAARALYRGLGATALREGVAYGAWFASFEHLIALDPRPRDEVPALRVAAYGGLAGECLWLASYPVDVVKSRLQTDRVGDNGPRFRSATHCALVTWRTDGWRGFWRGIGPTLLRAMPVSAGTFVVVEAARRAMG